MGEHVTLQASDGHSLDACGTRPKRTPAAWLAATRLHPDAAVEFLKKHLAA